MSSQESLTMKAMKLVTYDIKLVISWKYSAMTKLFDEQELAQAWRTYENGTYFDEIYFPRTAYEHINGLKIYETTHPPLGKTLISLGIRIFGMNPFGWRFMGTLMGVLLVPIIYLLALKLLKRLRNLLQMKKPMQSLFKFQATSSWN